MRLPTPPLVLTAEQREVLEKLSGSRIAAHREQQARVLLMAGKGVATTQIAARAGLSPATVTAWRERFEQEGLKAFAGVRPGRGRKRSISAEKVAEIVRATLHDKPPGETHWSCRSMAKAHGVSPATVQRIWSARELKPHRVKTFKLSNDKRFEEKLVDVVGLYSDPPRRAVVFCFDEKTQCQALDRTQPSLPMRPGRAGTMTHDYKRNGTTTLFAAIDTLEGNVLSSCMPRHRHQEFIKFLNQIDRETPTELAIHLIMDNYGTHKHANVKRWLQKHPRFHFHFIPTSSSWLNVVERFFRDITTNRIRRDSFGSVPELIKAIQEYIDDHNEDPRPFIWTAEADKILEKVGRARQALIRQEQRETLH